VRRERVTREEIESVVRGAGLSSTAEAAAVILETDGSFHVLTELGADCSAGARRSPGGAGQDARHGGPRREGDAA
jgi:uncharacterized membrane protein YcaP (DUF421 family)